MRALLIGCGNIGAGYDVDMPEMVWTHAKAYSLLPEVQLDVFDTDSLKMAETAERCHAGTVENISEDILQEYQLVSITTPTSTHFYYLSMCFAAKVPTIICEKPVVNNAADADTLQELYNKSASRVLVNYMRRFQPGYATAKDNIQSLLNKQSLRAIAIKYKRGLLNNCSHALDLLEFFFNSEFSGKDFRYTSAVYDSFAEDPTVTAGCSYLDCPVSIIGVADVSYPVFEIEIFFSDTKMVICHSGNEIRYYEQSNGAWSELITQRQTALLDKYMVPVMDLAMQPAGSADDNFRSSLRLNKQLLQIVEQINSTSNVKTGH